MIKRAGRLPEWEGLVVLPLLPGVAPSLDGGGAHVGPDDVES